jgi:hypothetical protein
MRCTFDRIKGITLPGALAFGTTVAQSGLAAPQSTGGAAHRAASVAWRTPPLARGASAASEQASGVGRCLPQRIARTGTGVGLPREAFLAGDKRGARAHYLRALELEPQWDILCNLGRAEGELGLDAEALTHLDECLKEYPPSRDPKVQKARGKFYDLRTEIRDRCEQMKCAYTEPPVSSGLATEPQVAAAATGATAAAANEPKEAAPASEPKPLDPKEHPSYIDKPSAKWPVVITTGALGVVGLGLGVGFHFVSEAAGDEAAAEQKRLAEDGIACEFGTSPECAQYAAKRSEYYDFRTGAIVGLVAGGALVTTAVVMAIVWPESKAPGGANLRPSLVVSSDEYFVGLQGKF